MKPLNLIKLKKEFYKRHDFESKDLEVLYNKFPKVSFKNIPEAWIVLIDKMLNEVGTYYIKSVEQHYGLLCITETNPQYLDLSIVDKYEKRIYNIDKDLHESYS